MKKYLIGSTLVAVALGWIVLPFCQAQTGAMREECDQLNCDDTPLCVPVCPVESCAMLPEDDQGAVCSVQPVRIEEAHDFNNAPAPANKLARSEPPLVATRKHGHEMEDREMDGTCGGITGSFDMTQSGNLTLNDNSVTTLSLSGQAQQNLSSMVNIISIESTISVMLNLNVNINSTVGTVNQGNTGTQNTGVQNTLTTVHP